MPGQESDGRSNVWYAFDYGIAHFVPIDGETEYPFSPESPSRQRPHWQRDTGVQQLDIRHRLRSLRPYYRPAG